MGKRNGPAYGIAGRDDPKVIALVTPDRPCGPFYCFDHEEHRDLLSDAVLFDRAGTFLAFLVGYPFLEAGDGEAGFDQRFEICLERAVESRCELLLGGHWFARRHVDLGLDVGHIRIDAAILESLLFIPVPA